MACLFSIHFCERYCTLSLWCQQKAVIGYLKNEIVLLIMNSPSEFLSGNPMGCFLSRRRVYSDLYRHLGNGCAFRQSADIGIEKRFFFNQSRSNPLKKFSVFQKNVFGNPHIPLEFRIFSEVLGNFRVETSNNPNPRVAFSEIPSLI